MKGIHPSIHYFSLTSPFYVPLRDNTTRTLQRHDLRENELTLDHIAYILFWPHKDMKGLPGWGMSSMPGSPPRQHKHERRYTPFTHPFIPTRRMWKDDYDIQMIFGDLVGLKRPDICVKCEENPEKTLPRKLVSTGIEPEPAAWQARMLPLAPQQWTDERHKKI